MKGYEPKCQQLMDEHLPQDKDMKSRRSLGGQDVCVCGYTNGMTLFITTRNKNAYHRNHGDQNQGSIAITI
jgi:hypothetical protein